MEEGEYMGKSRKALHDELRQAYLEKLREFLESIGEEVLQTNTNELACPCVDSAGNDEFIVFTLKVPTGARDGEPYDGYGEADSFAMKQQEKAIKAKEAATEKARKIARDKAAREAKAKAKAAHEAQQTKPTLNGVPTDEN